MSVSMRTFVLLPILFLGGDSRFCGAETRATPDEIMDEIAHLVMRREMTAPRWARVVRLRNELGAMGPNALSAIEERIEQESEHRVRGILAFSVGMLPGEDADKALLHYFCYEKDIASTAGRQLLWRLDRHGPFTFRVQDDQLATICSRVESGPTKGLGQALRILSMCAKNDVKPRVDVICERFVQEVTSPGDLPPVLGSPVSPRVFMLNKFLLAFQDLGPSATGELRARYERAKAAKDEELRKWIAMALGMCGEAGVSSYLKRMALHDPDKYVRCQAIHAYASAAGKSAIPTLRLLLDDKTETEFHADWIPSRYIIANAARDALTRLEQK